MAGIEYTEGGSLYTRLSMIATMLTIASLPVWIETARRTRSWGIGSALAVAFLAFLTYSLPATIGRTGEVKEVKVAEAKASGEGRKLLEQELTRTNARLQMAVADVAVKCKNAWSDNCKSARLVEAERQSRADQIRNELGAAPAQKPGDVGSDSLAWALTALGVPADAIRRFSALSFALGLDIIVWALIWFGTSDKIAGRKPVMVEDTGPKIPDEVEHDNTQQVIDWCKAYEAKHGRKPEIAEVMSAFDLAKTTAYRRLVAANNGLKLKAA
jgi:hypothetical protein